MMGIPHRHRNGLMSKQFLYLIEVDTVLYKPCSEGVSEVVKLKVLDPGPIPRPLKVISQCGKAVRKYPV